MKLTKMLLTSKLVDMKWHRLAHSAMLETIIGKSSRRQETGIIRACLGMSLSLKQGKTIRKQCIKVKIAQDNAISSLANPGDLHSCDTTSSA